MAKQDDVSRQGKNSETACTKSFIAHHSAFITLPPPAARNRSVLVRGCHVADYRPLLTSMKSIPNLESDVGRTSHTNSHAIWRKQTPPGFQNTHQAQQGSASGHLTPRSPATRTQRLRLDAYNIFHYSLSKIVLTPFCLPFCLTPFCFSFFFDPVSVLVFFLFFLYRSLTSKLAIEVGHHAISQHNVFLCIASTHRLW